MRNAPPELIDGRFRVERLVARGGMGSVYFARDLRDDGAAIALKVIDSSGGDSSASSGESSSASTNGEDAGREAELLSELRHPAIVRFVSSGTLVDGRSYIAMAWVDGEDLGRHLGDRALTVADTLRLGRRIAEALAVAHKIGVIHRDIKPANIILTDGCPELACLVDFGIAQVTSRAHHRGGTPGFAAPEQLVSGGEVDARADVFALGRVLIACLLHGVRDHGDEETPATDVTPGDLRPGTAAAGETLELSVLCPSIPPALEDLLRQMVAPRREDRPAHAGVVAAALQALAATTADVDGSVVSARENQLVATLCLPPDATRGPQAAAVQELFTRHDARPAAADATCEFVHLFDGDLITRAARCALELQRLLPDAAIALAIHQVRGDIAAPRLEAAELLRRMIAEGRRGVGLHMVAARLVGVRFEVESGPAGARLIGESPPAGDHRRLGRSSPFVGRDNVLAELRAAFDDSRERPVAVVVTGDGGMGKTRLAHEFLDRLERSPEPPRVMRVRGDSVAAASPFALLAQLIKNAAGISEEQPPRASQRQLRRYLQDHVAPTELQRLTTFIAELIGAPFSDVGVDALRAAREDPALMARQTERAWVDMIDALSRARPLVLWVDDLQWGDLASVRYLDRALDPANGVTHLLVLATARPEIHGRFPTLWSRRTVIRRPLTGLSADDCRTLVVAALGDRPLGDGTLADLDKRTHGNPLFLEELIRSFDANTFADLPATLVAIIQSRLQALEFDARQILRTASVLGQTFWREAVATLRGQRSIDDLARWLDALVAQELIVPRTSSRFPGTTEFEFGNATIRDAAYAMLTDADSQAAHLAAGEWLSRVGEGDSVVLAEHFLRGGDHLAATRRFAAAADHAFLRHEFDAVLQLTARALEHAPLDEARGRLLLRRAEVQGVSGHHQEAALSATAALAELPVNSPRWYSAVGEAAQASARLGDSARVAALLERLSDIRATVGGGGENFMGLVNAAVPLAAAGAAATARQLLDDVIRVTAKMAETDAGALGPMHAARGLRAFARGALGTLYEEMEAAATAFERVGSVRNSLEMAGGAAFVALELGCLERGEESLRRTIRRSRDVGLEHLCAVACHNLGRRIGEAGRFEEGLALEHAALTSFEAHDNRRMQGLTLAHIAWILLAAGRIDEALRSVDDALTRLHNHPASKILTLATRAQLHLRRGDVSTALADASAAYTGLQALDRVQEGESVIRLTWAEALAAAGRPVEAAEALAAAVSNLDHRAAMIEQEYLRVSFRGLPENRRILDLARAWRTASG